MLRARYPSRRPALTDDQRRSLCQLSLYDLVELLEEKRGKARGAIVGRIMRGLGWKPREIDAALRYHLTAKRMFILGGTIHIAVNPR